MNIYTGNLPYGLTEEELKAAFTEFGTVTSVKLIVDKYTGRSKGFGFVEMPDDAEAESAIKALHESSLKGRTINVNQAKPRTEFASRRPRY